MSDNKQIFHPKSELETMDEEQLKKIIADRNITVHHSTRKKSTLIAKILAHQEQYKQQQLAAGGDNNGSQQQNNTDPVEVCRCKNMSGIVGKYF